MRAPPLHVTVTNLGDTAALDALPARHGVLVFERGRDPSPANRTVAVVASGDLRAAAKRRLVESAHEGPGARVNLAPVTDRVLACVCASTFEADCAWLEIARERIPRTYRAALDRWRSWFLQLDADAEQPVWSRTDLSNLAGTGVDVRTLLGPIGTKDQSGRLGRWLDNTFELCREPKLLARRPNATPCSYKQMGACPAPCDGSEPMETYRSRVRDAVELVSDGPRARLSVLGEAIRDASAAMDFETAAEVRAEHDTVAELRKPHWSRATTLDRLAIVAVQPAGRKGWARVFLHAMGETVWLADVSAVVHPGVESSVRSRVAPVGRFELTEARAERIGLVGRRLFHPGKGAGTMLACRGDLDADAFWRAVRKAARVERDKTEIGDSELTGDQDQQA